MSSLFDTRWYTQSLRLLFGQGARTRCPWGENLHALWAFSMKKPRSRLSLFSRREGQPSASRDSGPTAAEARRRMKSWGSQLDVADELERDCLRKINLFGHKSPTQASLPFFKISMWRFRLSGKSYFIPIFIGFSILVMLTLRGCMKMAMRGCPLARDDSQLSLCGRDILSQGSLLDI